MKSELSSEATSGKRRRKGKKVITTILVIITLAMFGVSGVLFRKLQQYKKNPQVVAQEETQYVVGQVSKLMSLPANEQPTLATVHDKDKLKDQPFFSDAQNGDKLLVYTNAKKAIIFRIKEDKIINVGPIAIDPSQATPQPKQTR